MSSVQNLKQFVNDRLAAAAEEIFGVFQQTVSELENELKRQRELLDVFQNQSKVLLKPIDVQLHQMIKQEDSSEQECRPSLDPEEPGPSPKEDEKQVKVTLVQVKSEDQRAEEPSTSNWTQHMKTESDEDNCGESEPELHTLHQADHQMSLSSATDTDDSEDWRETSNSLSGLNTEQYPKRHASEKKDDAEHESLTCSRCERRFSSRVELTLHSKSCCKLFTCWFCGKRFENRQNLQSHVKIHRGEKPFSCSHCDKCFAKRCNLNYHMRMHSEEKPFTCSQCGKGFKYPGYLKTHMRSHTGEKPYICSKCGDCFKYSTCLSRHKKSATCT